MFNESTNYSMSIRITKHYSGSIKLPITQYNGSPYNFEGIIFGNNITRINGYAGGPYAAESTNIDVSENNILVYDTKHHINHTQFYNRDLIRDFVKFFKENIDIDYYESQPTNTGMVMLSSIDSEKLKQWASSHKFTEKVNSSKIFENILQEGWIEDKAAQTFEEYSKIRGYDAKEDLMQFAYYGSNSNFKRFAVNVAKLLPKDCDLNIERGGMAISVTYKGYGIGDAYRSVNDREVHCFKIEKPVIRFGIKNGSLNTEGAAKRFVDYLQPNITKAEIKAQEHEAREIKRNANADRIKQVQPDAKDLQRAKDAWNKAFHINTSTTKWNFSLGLDKYYSLWRQQNDKITDNSKADRRINAFYNFLLSQEPNIPDSYKSKFDNVKTRFEDRMKDINLHESVNNKTIFDKILNKSFCITYNDENLGIGWVSKDSMPTKKPEEAMTFDSKEAAEKKMKELDEIYDTHFQVKPIFNKSLNEGWTHRSGFVPHDGNRMVGGAWASSNNSGEYEKEIEIELDGTYYLVTLTIYADLNQGFDDSVNYSWADLEIDESSIQLKNATGELLGSPDVTDPELKNKLFELAKEKLLADPDKYFEDDWEDDNYEDGPDYEPDDF